MRILLYSSAFNSLTQRVYCELEMLGHELMVLLPCMWQDKGQTEDEKIQDLINAIEPDLIICPFLKHRIPDAVCDTYTCLVMHPGCVGDRGPSALDWCIFNRFDSWGVTLLQATQELDGGPVWGFRTFATRNASKASLYRQEVTQQATELIVQVVARLSQQQNIRKLPSPAEHIWRPYLKQTQRAIDWQRMDAKEICNRIRSADSQPGLKAKLNNQYVFLYGAHEGKDHGRKPGTIIGRDQGALCIATHGGSVWVEQIKRDLAGSFKLPAAYFLPYCAVDSVRNLSRLTSPFQEISSRQEGQVAYLHFDFYNGAMDASQCRRLKSELVKIKSSAVKVIVLCGGEEFWSNGIHLNVIEASDNPGQESWRNINAINDLVEEIIQTPDQITVAAISANAAAGGAVMALACDRVIIRDGVVLNPHYANMGLYGSEYWTYLLPRRIGEQAATAMTQQCKPLLAAKALELGLVDEIFESDRQQFQTTLSCYCSALSEYKNHRDITAYYLLQRQQHEQVKPLQQYRNEELAIMRTQFFDPDADYHRLRRAFVLKTASPLAAGVESADLYTKMDRESDIPMQSR